MGKPAARVGDMHTCPMVTPGLPPIPHVGGPLLPPGKPTVLIGGMPAATMGGMCTCVGPPDSIILGSTGVLIGGMPAARMGDTCAHGGAIVAGCPTVLIGEVSPGAPGAPPPPSPVVVKMINKQLSSVPAASGATNNAPAARSSSTSTGSTSSTASATREPTQSVKKDSIRCTLKGEDGKPIAGIKYAVRLPNGSVVKGETDSKGEINLSGIEPGMCEVEFPELHADEWKQS